MVNFTLNLYEENLLKFFTPAVDVWVAGYKACCINIDPSSCGQDIHDKEDDGCYCSSYQDDTFHLHVTQSAKPGQDHQGVSACMSLRYSWFKYSKNWCKEIGQIQYSSASVSVALPGFNESCTLDSGCEKNGNLSCVNGRCVCDNSTAWNETSMACGETEVPELPGFNESCTVDSGCEKNGNLSCVNGRCVCDNSTAWNETSMACGEELKPPGFKESCTLNDGCMSNLMCSEGTCRCEDSSLAWSDLGSRCFKESECTEFPDINIKASMLLESPSKLSNEACRDWCKETSRCAFSFLNYMMATCFLFDLAAWQSTEPMVGLSFLVYQCRGRS
jgi:hypothetical protein